MFDEILLLKCENGKKHKIKIEIGPKSGAANQLTRDAKFVLKRPLSPPNRIYAV